MSSTSPAAADRAVPGGGLAERPGPALAVLAASQLMIVLDATVVNIALPRIQGALHFSPTGLSWVLNAYTLTFGGLLLLGGRAGDLLGRRRVFVAGVLLFAVASLVGGFATSAAWLLTARAVQGVGGAMASPTALALVTTNFREGAERNRAMALFMAVSASGSALGLIVGGMLTSWVSWRWVLFVNAPIGIAAALLAPRVLRESDRARGNFDLPGAVCSTGGMALLVYGLIHASTDGWGNAVTLGSFAGAVVLLLAFLSAESRAAQPVVPLHLFADRNRSSSYAIMMVLTASMIGMFFFLSQFVQDVLGYSALRAGFAFVPMTAVLMVAAQIASQLVARTGPKPLMVVGAALATAGTALLIPIGPGSGYLAILGPSLLFGLGSGPLFVTLALVAVSGVPPREAGAASSALNVMQPVGGTLGLAILVTVYQTSARDAAAHPPAGLGAAGLARHVAAAATDRAMATAAVFTALGLALALLAVRARGGAPVGQTSRDLVSAGD